MAEILSPIPGTFYAKPSPDASPFVGVGSEVNPDTVVCLVEVMKTFHEVTAGVSGKIVEIKVASEDFVNPGDVLFVVQ